MESLWLWYFLRYEIEKSIWAVFRNSGFQQSQASGLLPVPNVFYPNIDRLEGWKAYRLSRLLVNICVQIFTFYHTLYLSFFLHGQNFWRIKFTPKTPIFRVNPRFWEKVNDSLTFTLADFLYPEQSKWWTAFKLSLAFSLRFRVAEKQGEKFEALLEEKLALSEKKIERKKNWPKIFL